MSALHEAIYDINDDQIAWLLDHGADVNAVDADGATPLILAVSRHLYPEQVEEILKRGADIHATDGSGRTPLMAALDHGSLDCVQLLLRHYALIWVTPAIDVGFEQGRLALLLAIYNDDIIAIGTLLAAGVDPNSKNKFGWSPLMMAVRLGRAVAAETLLRYGADVHARDTESYNQTVLHIAADEPHPDCTRVLLQHGADVDARDSTQATPLISAAGFSCAEVVRLLLEYGADIHAEDAEGSSALSKAGWIGDAETIHVLLEWGAASNKSHLCDAFHASFEDNNRDKAPLFIQAGLTIGLPEAVLLWDMARIEKFLADGIAQDEIDLALGTACQNSSLDLVQLLLERGADPNANKALKRAHWNSVNRTRIIDALLQAGADVNVTDSEGETPFLMAIRGITSDQDDLEWLENLLRHGADINVQCKFGTSALILAALFGKVLTAEFLLRHGAEINLRDGEGRTALIHAAAQGHTEMVRLLLEHGASTTDRATDGATALNVARRWVGKGIDALLLKALI